MNVCPLLSVSVIFNIIVFDGLCYDNLFGLFGSTCKSGSSKTDDSSSYWKSALHRQTNPLKATLHHLGNLKSRVVFNQKPKWRPSFLIYLLEIFSHQNRFYLNYFRVLSLPANTLLRILMLLTDFWLFSFKNTILS